MAGTYLLQQLAAAYARSGAASFDINATALPAGWLAYSGYLYDIHHFVFVVGTDWYLRPWSPITSTFAHSLQGIGHLAVNGLMLYFIGPTVERVLGTKRYVTLFLTAGAIAGIAQVHLTHAMTDLPGLALGASGAIMAILGVLVILFPKDQILIWGIVPAPMWLVGVGYIALDVLGVFNPYDRVGNIAHLTGVAIGLAIGWKERTRLKERGMQWTRQ